MVAVRINWGEVLLDNIIINNDNININNDNNDNNIIINNNNNIISNNDNINTNKDIAWNWIAETCLSSRDS